MRQLPDPVRTVCVAGGALLSVLGAYDRKGAPSTRALGPEALREDSVTWLGHSGFLVRLGGQSVMIDPILSDMFQIPLSPRRIAAAPDIAALDRVDAVLISHEDHDHYDLPTLRGIARAFPQALLLVPPEIRPDPAKLGFARVITLSQWDSVTLGRLKVTATPAVHYGRRDLLGLTPHPAVGWGLRAGARAVFHAGDTARGPVHNEIGERLGPFDLALVPIGAFKPENAVGDLHASPECALAIAAAVRAKRAVGMHWGTFALSADSPAEAQARFLGAAAPGKPKPMLISIGETTSIRSKNRPSRVRQRARPPCRCRASGAVAVTHTRKPGRHRQHDVRIERGPL